MKLIFLSELYLLCKLYYYIVSDIEYHRLYFVQEMYSFKLSVPKSFSMSVAWNILCILAWSVSLTFRALLRNQECIFLALLSC